MFIIFFYDTTYLFTIVWSSSSFYIFPSEFMQQMKY